jgi:nucleoside phosphorylase
MAKDTKRSAKKKVKLKNALNSARLSVSLSSLSPEFLAEFLHDLGLQLYYWMGDPTEERIQGLRKSLPLLNQYIDFDIVLQRLNRLDDFNRNTFGISIQEFFPELQKIREKTAEAVFAFPSGIAKAENWLRPIAKNASADADVEAAVYFASRGFPEIIDASDLRNGWHAAVCYNVTCGGPIGKVPKTLLQRAQARTLSLAEAASALSFNDSISRFFSFRDEEEDFIDAAMFRAVEWFGISGFEPWLRSSIIDLSVGPQYGIEHTQASWGLFHWCRSDLAIRMADRRGLEAWLWAFINGTIERDKPWVQFNFNRENPGSIVYIPIAAVLPFVWHRIKPANMSPEILNRASELLFQTQLCCGAWPTYSTEAEGSLMATCFAIHGLATHRPTGWKQAVEKAAQWLESEQADGGYWYVQGGPVVMITVLVLDALALARRTGKLTFNLGESSDGVSQHAIKVVSGVSETEGTDVEESVYDFSYVDWYKPGIPPLKSVPLSQAQDAVSPDVALVVAIEIELLQALRVMTPLPRRKRLWKVMHDCDTYYLGRFGAFTAVVVLSNMGSSGAGGSTLCVNSTISTWKPRVVILPGIAFGASRKKYQPGDVLVAEHVIPYENQRIGDETIFRNPVPPSSTPLFNRFRNALGWRFVRPDDSPCKQHVGPLLSGEKLVDNLEFKEYLLKQYPNAIGGEMEGAGLWSAASRHRIEWIIVKGVCDWGDGRKHNEYQSLAAAASVSLCQNVLADLHSLDGI